MARPKGADPELTKRRLLSAAAEHFTQYGVEATSLRKVARDANVSLATIHYYFRTKRALHDACLDALYNDLASSFAPMREMFQSVTRQVQEAKGGQEVLADKLDGIVRGAFRFALEHRSELRLIMRGLLEAGELDARWRERALIPFLDQTSRALAGPLGRSVLQVRLDIQSLVALGMRYTLSTPEEFGLLVGLSELPCSDEHARDAGKLMEDHLVGLAIRLLTNETKQDQRDQGRR